MASNMDGEIVNELIEDGVVEDRAEFDEILDERYGLSYDQITEVDALLEEYQSELEALNEEYADKVAELGLSDQFDLEGTDLPFESLLDQLSRTFDPQASGETTDDPLAQLRELKRLNDEDVITYEEYDVTKSQLLGRI